MYLTIFLATAGLATTFATIAAIKNDRRFLIPAGGLYIVTASLLLLTGLQLPTGSTTKVPSPTTRETTAATAGTLDTFGIAINKNYDTIFDYESTRPISLRRDRITGSGETHKVTHVGGEYQVTAGNGTVNFMSAEESIYTASKTGLWGIGIRIPANFNTSTAAWKAGLFDQQNGFYVGQDQNGTFAAIRFNGSVIKKVYRENWNGYNHSLCFSCGFILQGRFVYYGYGGPVDAVLYAVPDNNTVNESGRHILPSLVRLHTFDITGQTTFTSTRMPLHIQINATNTSTSESVYVGGRHYSLLGKYDKLSRITSTETNNTINSPTSWTQIVTWRHSQPDKSIRTKIAGFTALTECPTQWQWRLHTPDAVSNNPSWVLPDGTNDNETQMQVSYDATVPVSAGVKVDSAYLTGANNKPEVGGRLINDIIPPHLYASLFFRRVSGTNNCQIDTISSVTEYW